MSKVVTLGPVKIEPLEWWCDRCKYGTWFDPGNERTCRLHAELHANTHGVDPRTASDVEVGGHRAG